MPPTPAEFLKKTLLAAHARGLVFREVPVSIYKLAVRNTVAELNTAMSNAPAANRKKFEYALSVKAAFEHTIHDGLCGAPVTAAFTETAFRDGGFRDDAVAVLAYSMTKDGREFKLVGVSSWGAADPLGTDDVELAYHRYPNWQQRVEQGSIVEVDILCTKPSEVGDEAVKGYGSLILAYCLARAAARKRGGQARYVGAIMNLAFHGQGRNRHAPMARIAQRFGFTSMRDVNRAGMFVGIMGTAAAPWYTAAYNAVPDGDADFKILCPLVPRTGKSYCA